MKLFWLDCGVCGARLQRAEYGDAAVCPKCYEGLTAYEKAIVAYEHKAGEEALALRASRGRMLRRRRKGAL